VFEAGALLLIPFPFSDLSSAKRRPVLALTAPDPNGDFIACPATSRDRWANARRLLPEHMIEGALPLPSWVRTDHVVTLHIALVVKVLGRASGRFRVEVARDLCQYLQGQPPGAT
jgi:mRNA interferase MazF